MAVEIFQRSTPWVCTRLPCPLPPPNMGARGASLLCFVAHTPKNYKIIEQKRIYDTQTKQIRKKAGLIGLFCFYRAENIRSFAARVDMSGCQAQAAGDPEVGGVSASVQKFERLKTSR